MHRSKKSSAIDIVERKRRRRLEGPHQMMKGNLVLLGASLNPSDLSYLLYSFRKFANILYALIMYLRNRLSRHVNECVEI